MGKEWDPANIESVINFPTRPEKVQESDELNTDNKEVRDIVQAIHVQDTFPCTYGVWESADVNGDYPDPGHDVDGFKTEARVAVEFQLLSANVKASKKIDAVKPSERKRINARFRKRPSKREDKEHSTALAEMIANLNSYVTQLRTFAPTNNHAQIPPIGTNPHHEQKTIDPPLFAGDRSKARTRIMGMRLKLAADIEKG